MHASLAYQKVIGRHTGCLPKSEATMGRVGLGLYSTLSSGAWYFPNIYNSIPDTALEVLQLSSRTRNLQRFKRMKGRDVVSDLKCFRADCRSMPMKDYRNDLKLQQLFDDVTCNNSFGSSLPQKRREGISNYAFTSLGPAG